MTPADCHSLLSDEEPPLPWSYRYSTAEECLALKQEPEWDAGGESEAASWACLYADHDVKEEIVFGPELLQPQDIAISMQHALIKTEEDPYILKLTDEPRTEYISSPTLSAESQSVKTFEQLPYCFVRLERFILGGQHSSSSLTDKPFICNICQRQFAGQNYLTNHIKTHIGYFCHICMEKFEYPRFLTAHIEMHKAKPYTCNVCKKLFTQSSELNAHMLEHTMAKPYHYNIYQKQFTVKKKLYKHMHQCHPDHTKPKYNMHHHKHDNHMRMRPPKANKQLTHTQDHEKDKPHCCTICQRRFVYRKTLLTHMRVRHAKANEKLAPTQDHEKEKPHCCIICQRRFVYRKTLLTHMRVRHPKANEQFLHTQDHEEEKLNEPNKQLAHNPDLSEGKPHCCDICQRRFMYTKTLLYHMRRRHKKPKERTKQLIHEPDLTKEKPHCCDICQRRFVYRKTLVTHMRKHPENKCNFQHTQPPRFAKEQARCLWLINQCSIQEKSHSCDICHRRFVYRKTLLTHMRLRHKKVNVPNKKHAHNQDLTEEKPHCCDVCQRRFMYRKTLMTHMRLQHQKMDEPNKKLARNQDLTKEKPHCCDVCQRRFMYRKTLLYHMRRRHKKPKERNEQLTHETNLKKEKPNGCSVCRKRFVYRKSLITHMRKHPGSKLDTQVTPPFSLDKESQNLILEKPHCCKICPRRFVYRKTLLTHMRVRHPKANDRLKHTQDHEKEKSNEPNKHLTRHPKATENLTHTQDHEKEKPHCCTICQRRFVYRKTLLTHMRVRHPKANNRLKHTQDHEKEKSNEPNKQLTHNPDLTEGKPHCCDICHKKFMYRKTLVNHMRLRHQKVELNKQLAQNRDKHQKVIESKNQQVTPPNSTKHEQDHGKEKLQCCDICQKRFVYRKSLISHMRKHSGNRPDTRVTQPSSLAKQRHCQKRFVYKKTHSRLERQRVKETVEQLSHNLDLTKEKPHCCEICQRRFVYRKTLMSHMLKHPEHKRNFRLAQPPRFAKQQARRLWQIKQGLIQEKAHYCDICQRRFMYRKNFMTHMRLQHQKVKELNEQLEHTQDLTKEKPYCCDICQSRFMYRKTLMTHMRLQHQKVNEPSKQHSHNQNLTEEKAHCCDICQRRFMYRKTLMTHMRLQHQKANEPSKQHSHNQNLTEEKAHCCDICQRRFMYRKTLMTHMRLQHQKVNEPNKPHSHNQNLTEEKPHCCDICPRRFMYRKTLLTHMRLRHRKVNEPNNDTCNHDLTKEKSHCCKICQRRFVYRKTLMTHMRKHPEIIPKVQIIQPPRFAKQQARHLLQMKQDFIQEKAHCCEICQRRFVYRKTLLTHMRIRHQKVNKPDDQQITRPYSSSSSTKSKEDSTKEKPHRCSFCRKRFVYKKTLVTHMRLRHQKASELNKELTSRFTKHKRNLTDEKRHRCDICEKRFVYEKALLTHMRQHTETANKPLEPSISVSNVDFVNKETHSQQNLYTCDICEKQFAHKNTLDNHLRLHSAVKPYVCSVCSKRFTELSSLTSHKRIHTTGKYSFDTSERSDAVQKPYSCNLCCEQFSDLNVLIDHAQRWHAEEGPFRCNIQSVTK
ncbi:uncharacterized protein [Choristoneura fumiferana]|uniref:uncharacterized protein n=1 Tax=Choristoneura fumiferana TaxID=7141 RepID=UPI003D15A21D